MVNENKRMYIPEENHQGKPELRPGGAGDHSLPQPLSALGSAGAGGDGPGSASPRGRRTPRAGALREPPAPPGLGVSRGRGRGKVAVSRRRLLPEEGGSEGKRPCGAAGGEAEARGCPVARGHRRAGRRVAAPLNASPALRAPAGHGFLGHRERSPSLLRAISRLSRARGGEGESWIYTRTSRENGDGGERRTAMKVELYFGHRFPPGPSEHRPHRGHRPAPRCPAVSAVPGRAQGATLFVPTPGASPAPPGSAFPEVPALRYLHAATPPLSSPPLPHTHVDIAERQSHCLPSARRSEVPARLPPNRAPSQAGPPPPTPHPTPAGPPPIKRPGRVR